jgi:hypothetical protein
MELAEFSKETLADIQVRPIERSEETQYQQHELLPRNWTGR